MKAPVITQTCQNLFSPPRLSISTLGKLYRCWARIIAEAWPDCLEHLDNTPVYSRQTRFCPQPRVFQKLLLSALTTPTPAPWTRFQQVQSHEPAHRSRPQQSAVMGKGMNALALRLLLSSRRRRKKEGKKGEVLSFTLFAVTSAIMDRERAVFSRFIPAATRSWRAAELPLSMTISS